VLCKRIVFIILYYIILIIFYYLSIVFIVPVVCREPKDHSSDCYVSLTNITSKSKHKVKYTGLLPAMRTVHKVKSCLHQSLRKF